MDLPLVQDVGSLRGKRVLLRLDLNVPIEGGVVANDFRIKKEFPFLKLLVESGARVVIISHIGSDSTQSLFPVFKYLKVAFPNLVFERTNPLSAELSFKTRRMEDGACMLLENLRRTGLEESNDPDFAQSLALLGDVFVNDAFSASHRRHASIISLPHFLPSFAGPLFASEVENLSRALVPDAPFYVILGGAKISSKLPLLEKFLDIADGVFVYGALAHDLFLARGMEVGKSLVDATFSLSEIAFHKKITLPEDVVVVSSQDGRLVKPPRDLKRDETIYDAGPKSIALVAKKIKGAKTILWNGPLGNFEKGFSAGTEELARVIAGERGAFSIVGGGDTIAAIAKLGAMEKFGFVSTGGGAMLEFLAKGTLPGISAILESGARRS